MVRELGSLMHWVMFIQNHLINPLVRVWIRCGLAPPTYALIETTGRKSGRPRQVPVANGLQGETFWLIASLGEQSQYVKNMNAHPQVRVKARPARLRDGLRMRWRSGTVYLMPDDNARDRHRDLGRGRLGYKLDGILLRAGSRFGKGMMTIRIELDPLRQSGGNS
jgi:deazaflavin-dependent oxidoreductase (nitroreductase family)